MRLAGIVLVVLIALALVGCGGGSSSDESLFPQSGDADHWAEVWCEISGTMTQDEVIELMGEPSQEYDASSGFDPQNIWETSAMEYAVFYDPSGNVNSAMVVLRSGTNPTNCAENRNF